MGSYPAPDLCLEEWIPDCFPQTYLKRVCAILLRGSLACKLVAAFGSSPGTNRLNLQHQQVSPCLCHSAPSFLSWGSMNRRSSCCSSGPVTQEQQTVSAPQTTISELHPIPYMPHWDAVRFLVIFPISDAPILFTQAHLTQVRYYVVVLKE